MSSEWRNWLIDQGTPVGSELVEAISSPSEDARAALEESTITPLLHLGVIRVGGADAATFLQNQLTSDIRQVDDGHSQFTAWCSPKGRVLSCFRLYHRGDEFFLLLPVTLLPAILEKLRRYVLISQVTLEDVTAHLALLGIAGTEAASGLREHGATPPAGMEQVTHDGGISLLRIPGPVPRFVAAGDSGRLQALYSSLTGSARVVGSAAWRLLDIRAGLPEIQPQTVEAFVPQMINLDRLGGVSFDKGCYPGQEVVARLHYLGRLKRRMYRARVADGRRPAPGELLLTAENGREVGKVVDAQPDPSGGNELLAVFEITAIEQGERVVPAGYPDCVVELLPEESPPAAT